MNATELAALAAPFAADQVDWKAQAVSGNRALAVPYIDARTVMDRLDRVLGPGNWWDAYTVQPCGSVVCRLTIVIEGACVTKEDVGSPSEQSDKGDQLKAAFSDALKRAAVKWGIGRYLYSLPKQWVDYDPQKKRLLSTPTLPTWAVPKPPEPKPANGNGPFGKRPEPKTGSELSMWLDDLDSWLAERGHGPKGHVRTEVVRLAGTNEPIERWPVATVNGSVLAAKALAQKLRQGESPLAKQLRMSIEQKGGAA
jgi:hypothetical protein